MVKFEYQNLTITKGDTCLLKLELVDENNEVVDLTGCNGVLTVKEYLNDATIKQKISLPIFTHEDSDPANGVIFFKFLPANTQSLNTKKYYYDIQITRETDIYTIIRGDLYIDAEITFNT